MRSTVIRAVGLAGWGEVLLVAMAVTVAVTVRGVAWRLVLLNGLGARVLVSFVAVMVTMRGVHVLVLVPVRGIVMPLFALRGTRARLLVRPMPVVVAVGAVGVLYALVVAVVCR